MAKSGDVHVVILSAAVGNIDTIANETRILIPVPGNTSNNLLGGILDVIIPVVDDAELEHGLLLVLRGIYKLIEFGTYAFIKEIVPALPNEFMTTITTDNNPGTIMDFEDFDVPLVLEPLAHLLLAVENKRCHVPNVNFRLVPEIILDKFCAITNRIEKFCRINRAFVEIVDFEIPLADDIAIYGKFELKPLLPNLS